VYAAALGQVADAALQATVAAMLACPTLSGADVAALADALAPLARCDALDTVRAYRKEFAIMEGNGEN
jgi:hypothetical protein